MLSLFTSKKNLNYCKDYLYKELYDHDILCQYEKSRKRLIESFKSNYNSTLLGCKSFFTGVDIQGQSLRCIIVDKLPFSYWGDPINKKLKQNLNYFHEYYLPEMIITLKQATGRGVRSIDDKCIICILDERIISSNYSERILNSFNYNMNFTRELFNISSYLEVNSNLGSSIDNHMIKIMYNL